MTYADKLKDPRWQRKRLEVFQRDHFTCLSCNSTTTTLQVHHLKYLSDLDPWEYEMCYLITYCQVCHETEHLIGDNIRQIHLEVLKANPMFIKPLAQTTNLITEFPPFFQHLKQFLNDMTIEYLRSKEINKAA
jgi:5-methylcytosine-specific restriction endonuclease McrA